MTERPIIFSTPMVDAIFAGRKTMTRRLLKPAPQRFRLTADDPAYGLSKGEWCPVDLQQFEDEPWPRVSLGRVITRQQVRYKPGMTLWVREAWAKTRCAPIVETIDNPMTVYRAADNRTDYGGPWRSPIHMRRSDCRLMLSVEAVRIERLHSITNDDAKAEGALRCVPAQASISGRSLPPSELFYFGEDPIRGTRLAEALDARQAFELLWDHIHGAGAWETNPYVVVISFSAR